MKLPNHDFLLQYGIFPILTASYHGIKYPTIRKYFVFIILEETGKSIILREEPGSAGCVAAG